MKRTIYILIGLTGAAWSVLAQDSPTLNWSYFEPVAQKNIFDPSRAGGRSRRSAEIPRQVVVLYFTYHGTMDDRAIFTGEGTPDRGYVKVGDMINGFKVMKVTLDGVELAEPSGNLVVLNTDESMKREDQGPWTKTDQTAPLVITPAAPAGDASAASTSTSGASDASGGGSTPFVSSMSRGSAPGESDILKRLRMKREQEGK